MRNHSVYTPFVAHGVVTPDVSRNGRPVEEGSSIGEMNSESLAQGFCVLSQG